jgi:hypothetical protein
LRSFALSLPKDKLHDTYKRQQK